MSWYDKDNKLIRGKPDSMYVSMTEPYELDEFVAKFLDDWDCNPTAKNTEVVIEKIKQYPGRAPIRRDALTDYLRSNLTRE